MSHDRSRRGWSHIATCTARTVGRILRVRAWDVVLRFERVPEVERLRLIAEAAERDLKSSWPTGVTTDQLAKYDWFLLIIGCSLHPGSSERRQWWFCGDHREWQPGGSDDGEDQQERRGVPDIGRQDVAEDQLIRTAMLAGADLCHPVARARAGGSTGSSITLMVARPDLQQPVSLTSRWVRSISCGSSLPEAVGSAVAATLIGTVPAAITPLAKSTSYPKFDRSG